MTEVVAALIWDNDKFMICQRPANKARAFFGSLLEVRLSRVKQKNKHSSGSAERNLP